MKKKNMINKNLLCLSIAMSMSFTQAAWAANAPTAQEQNVDTSAMLPTTTNEIIVRYKDNVAASHDMTAKMNVVQSAVMRSGLANVRLNRAGVEASYSRKLAVGADLIRLNGITDKAQVERVLRELKADPTVKYAELNGIEYPVDGERVQLASDAIPQQVPNDQHYQRYQWHMHNPVGGINVEKVWDSNKGEGVVVAVLDTGILPDHPDFGDNLLEGYDFIIQASRSRRPADGRVPGALDYGDWRAAEECGEGTIAANSGWHGTHVAGTVAEASNNAIGMAGVAPNATILPVRVLGKCGGLTSDISDAIIWAAGGDVDGVPKNENPAEIINMSLGGLNVCGDLYQEAINKATALGALVIVSAGNNNRDTTTQRPANCQNVMAIAATGIAGARASYSNYGAKVDISAPGGGGGVDGNPNGYVWQTGYGGATTPTSGTYGYYGKSGTSMAAPHVAGVAALVQSSLTANGHDPLGPDALKTLLKTSVRPFPAAVPADRLIGTGLLDADKAVTASLTVPNKQPVAGLSGEAGSEKTYLFNAQAGAVFSILTYGGSGNVSLYVKRGAAPTTTDYDARSVRPGNSETVRFTAPVAGTYYITVRGETNYQGVTLNVRQ